MQTSIGAQLLRPILRRLKHQKGGSNIFCRVRLTHQNTGPNPISNFSRIATSVWNGWRLSDWGSKSRPAQLENLEYQLDCRELAKLFEIWWTRGDSNPRPPRCERGALPAELLAHEQQPILANAAHLANTPSLDCKQEGAPRPGPGAPKTTIATATDSTAGCLRHRSAAP